MGPVAHQLMDAAGVAGLEFTGPLAGREGHHLAGTVGHVGDDLMAGAVGEEHCLVGVAEVVVLHVFKIVDWGLAANPLKLKRI